MVKIYLKSVVLLLFLYGCSSNDKKSITYQQLPSDVKAKFQYTYNYWEPPEVNAKGDTVSLYTPKFSECYDLDKNCNCVIESKGGIFRNPFFVLKSCDYKNIKISWEVLERVFIIKNDSVYYPYQIRKVKYNDVNNGEEFDQVIGGLVTSGKSRSYNVKIDTLKFIVEKMR